MNWLTNNWKFIAIALASVVVLSLITYFYVNKSGFMVKQGFQNPVDTNATHEFIMYYATWCPHCKTALPDFEKFAESGVTVAGQPIKVSKYDNKKLSTRGQVVKWYTRQSKKLVPKGVRVRISLWSHIWFRRTMEKRKRSTTAF